MEPLDMNKEEKGAPVREAPMFREPISGPWIFLSLSFYPSWSLSSLLSPVAELLGDGVAMAMSKEKLIFFIIQILLQFLAIENFFWPPEENFYIPYPPASLPSQENNLGSASAYHPTNTPICLQSRVRRCYGAPG